MTEENNHKPAAGEEFRSWRYKIQQVAGGARVTVHGDALEETVAEYVQIRTRLENEGFRIAPEE